MSEWAAGRHLAPIYEALYSSLGRVAPQASWDAAVVRLHEASRAFGELSLEIRDGGDVDANSLVTGLLTDSLSQDQTGALTLYALAMVVGPRLLVTLRDYLQVETHEDRRPVLVHGSDIVVLEIRRVGAMMGHRESPDDPQWTSAARAMAQRLDGIGWAESLGQGS